MIDPATAAQIEAALAANRIADAARLAEAALARGQRDPMLFNLAAWAREEAGDYAAAFGLLQQALALTPGDPLVRTAIGTVLRKDGRYDEALRRFDDVIATTPDYAVVWLERGYALEETGRLAEAAQSHARAAALDPGLAPAFAGMAGIAARTGDRATVAAQAERALAIDPHNAIAICALAASAIDGGAPADALAPLAALLARDPAAEDRIAALTLIGDAHDRLGEGEAAFAAYRDANAAFAALHAPRFAGNSMTDFIAHVDAAFAAQDVRGWALADETPLRDHAFLLGYPRSGTTLTENILASAPGVEALEEKPTLRAADEAFLLPLDGIARLATLDATGAQPYRAAYWQAVAAHGAGAPGGLFVDMDPLKGLRLPLIGRLFPQARILIMRRDPRDVVWSCFRRNFRATAAAYEFTDLERTARHYDALMRLTERCCERLTLAVHTIDYGDLVTRFDATTQRLCRFLDLPWSPELRRFDRTADRRGVGTASAAQVRRGLYNGEGQWRRYAAQMAPILPILAPWVERFGLAA